MVIIVASVVTTVIGFTKVSNQQSKSSSTQLNKNISSPTPSTVVMDNSILLSNYSHNLYLIQVTFCAAIFLLLQ